MFDLDRKNEGKFADWFRNIDKTLVIIVVVLFFLGLFFSFSSTSSIVAEKLNTQNYYFFIKHLIFVLMALGFIFFISFQKKEVIKKIFPYIFFITLVLLFLVPFFGLEIKGSKRWLEFLFLPRFQPIEILKPFFILIIAKILTSNLEKNMYKKYIETIVILFVVLILLIIQPDLGQTILLFSTWLMMIFISGVNLIILTFFFTISLIAISTLILLFPDKFGYIFLRLKSFVDPSQGDNYQSDKALESIINGGFFGKGI